MVRTTLLLALASVATSCGDTGPEPVQFAEHCGAREPVRLLELQPDQYWLDTDKVGDRLYHRVARTDAAGKPIYPPVDRQLWSTGPCGESPHHFADDLALLNDATDEHNPWPELLLACLPGTGVVIVDPDDRTPPRALFPGEDCHGSWTAYGYLQLELTDPSFEYRLYPYPDDPHEGPTNPILVIGDLRQPGVLDVKAGTLHVVNDEFSLLRIDLADLDPTVIQTNVRDFAFSPDGRYLLWQDAAPTGGDPGNPSGALILRDTTTDSSLGLGESGSYIAFHSFWPGPDLLVFDQDGTDRLYYLPELDFVDMPSGGQLVYPGEDGSLLLLNDYQGDWLSRFSPSDRTITPLFSRRSQIRGVLDDAATVLDIPFDSNNQVILEGTVWSVPLDGSRARILADRATARMARIDATRLVTSVDTGAAPRYLATFLVVDTDTRTESIIDDHLVQWGIVDFDDRTLLTYTKYDGERTGIWQARLPSDP